MPSPARNRGGSRPAGPPATPAAARPTPCGARSAVRAAVHAAPLPVVLRGALRGVFAIVGAGRRPLRPDAATVAVIAALAVAVAGTAGAQPSAPPNALAPLAASAQPDAGEGGATNSSGAFIGFGVGLYSDVAGGTLPILGLQGGADIAPGVTLRASIDTFVVVSSVALDVLATIPIDDPALQLYAGGGPDLGLLLFGVFGDGVVAGGHATVGVAAARGSLRPFAEVQPALFFGDGGSFVARIRGGVNLHF